MRLGTLLAVLVFTTSPLFGQINFSDNFSSGLSPTYWTVTEIPSNSFTIDTSAGKLSLTADSTVTSEYGGIYLSSSALGIPVGGLTGDFSESLTFSNANISSVGSGNNINLDAIFEGGSPNFFVDAYTSSDSLGTYVYGDVPSETGPYVATSATGGTFNISRNGSIVYGWPAPILGTSCYESSHCFLAS
jgi:hypothetical protein